MRKTLAAMIVVFASAAANAQPHGADPDWPCIQRLVPQISAAQVWTGPVPEREMWADDLEVVRLAAKIAARRTPMEDVRDTVASFSQELDTADRDRRLAGLFGRALQVINSDRASLIAGIKRFARKQARLADRIRETRVSLSTGNLAEAQRADLSERLHWDLRIYEDREQSQIFLCEQPVLLEQRAFALGRVVGAHLDQ